MRHRQARHLAAVGGVVRLSQLPAGLAILRRACWPALWIPLRKTSAHYLGGVLQGKSPKEAMPCRLVWENEVRAGAAAAADPRNAGRSTAMRPINHHARVCELEPQFAQQRGRTDTLWPLRVPRLRLKWPWLHWYRASAYGGC